MLRGLGSSLSDLKDLCRLIWCEQFPCLFAFSCFQICASYIDLRSGQRGFLSLQVCSSRKMALVGRAEVRQNGEERLEGICHEGGMLSRLEENRMKGKEMCSKPAKS